MTNAEEIEIARGKLLAISRWIDESPRYQEESQTTVDLWRVTKLAEEAGEAVSALFGAMGENPRKGCTHSRADVEYELLDVAVTALGAVAHGHGNQDVDPIALLLAHIDKVYDRAGRP